MAEFTDADVGLAPSGPVEFSDADIGLAPAPPRQIPLDPASQPGLGDRFRLNAREAFQDTIAGEVRNRVRSGQLASDTAADMARALREATASGSPVGLDAFGDGRPSPYAAVPLQQLQEMQTQTAQGAEQRNAEYTQLRGEQRREFAQLPSFTEAPSLWGKAVQGAVSLAGSVAGSMPSPENLIAAPVARGGVAARAAGESLPKYFGRMAAPGAAEGMAANVPANVAVQTGQVERGERPEFSGTELGEAVVLGAGIGASFRMVGPLYKELRASIARRKGVTPDSINPDSIGPQEVVDAINEDPVFAGAARANGIEGPDDPRFAILQDRLAKRRIEESLRPAPDNYGADGRPVTSDDWRNTPKGVFSEEVQRRQDERANLGQANQEPTTQNGVTAQTARATEEGTINPQATNIVPREPDTRPIAVQPDGGAYRADDATMQGRNREQVTREARTLRLPAPGREVPTDAEIARMRPAPEAPPVEAPPKLYGSEDRAPQTSADMLSQRQADQAFTLADRQRGRAGDDVRDTQVAGRPRGVDDNQDVLIDTGTGYAVRFKNLGDGGRIWVEAYDPRSGNPLDGVQPFQVSTTALQRRSYAVDPRRAQDFEARAGTPQGERMGLPRQTYRTTAPDAQNGAGGPASNVKPSLRPREGGDGLEPGLTQTGKRSTRNAFPEQAAGEAPAPKPRGGFGNYEEAMRDFKEREARGQTEPPKSGPDYSKAKSSNQAGPKDRDGRFVVDENGHVMSSAQGPIRFADQKQAAKWILNVGQKQSPDQIFEIAVHPTGKGFTARERGRSESPPPGGKAEPETDAATPRPQDAAPPATPRGLEGPRVEKTPEPPAAATPEQSFDDKVRAERDRLWDEDMGRAKRTKASNDRAVEATARENVMRQEVGPEAIREAEVMGMVTSRDDITDIAQLYRRKEGQSPQEAWEDAYGKWVDKNESEAMRDANLFTQEDMDFDPLKVDSNSDAAKMADIYTQEAQQTAREAKISRDSADNIPFDEVPNGKREADRPADAAGRQDAKEQSPERGGTRQEAGGGREGARDYATDAGPDGGRQTVVPGAERDTRGANQRRADAPLRGGDEAPPRGGLFDEDSRNQATFFSNPFLDPAAWKGLGKMLGLHSGYVRHMRAMFNDIKDMRDGSASKKTWTMTDIGRSIMWSNDGQLGALEKAYKSPTIASIRDWLHPEADMGRQGTSPKRGYHEATDIRTQDNLNQLSRVLDPFEDNKSAKDQIVRLIQNPGNIKRGTPIHDAAANIRSMLDDELKYLKAAGVDISEIKTGGYWPRIVDAFSVLHNQEKFLRAASRQYLKDRLAANRTQADEMALAWLESIQMGGVGMRKEGTDFVMLGGTPNADFKRERVFGPSIERETNNPLREFYVQDPADVLTLHFQRTARRAEWAREMGDDLSKWKLKKDAIVKEGGIAALPQVVDLIANATGISKSYISPHARSAVSVIRSLGVFGTLSLAAASSIAETAMPAIRAGNPARLVGDVGRTIKALAGGMKNERAWAEDLGVIVNALGDSILGRRYHALEAGNKFQQRTMNRYFQMTGLEQLTTAQRVVAVAGAQAYLRRQAINLTDGGKRTKSAQDFLSELGIAGKDAEGFSKWLLQQADGKPTSASVKDDGAYGSMYRTAMHRFIRQTNMDPNTSTRPAWANDPYKSLMFQLNSYTWAFQKNVLNRAGAGIVKGVTGKGYTMQDRMAFLAPAMMLPVLYAIQAGVGEIRDNVFADPTAKPKDEKDKMMRNLDRAGAFGQASPLMNFITGVRYERDLASSFAGPALGNLLRPIETAIKATGDRNSPNTNTRERALAKDMYRGFVFPVVAGAMAAAAPMGVGALAIQALNTGEAREAATSAVAGPKPVERPQRPKPPQPPRPPRPPRP